MVQVDWGISNIQTYFHLFQGKDLSEAAGIKNSQIAKELSLPPVKLHCSMLAEDAIKAALKDYKTKQEAQN